MDEVSEASKAVQEVAKTTAEGIAAGRSIGQWLDRIFGDAVAETVNVLWTNKVRERSIASAIYSWERLELLLHKTERRLRKRGVVNYRALQPKVALPLLNNATLEDEDDLHSLWAALLASALDANGTTVHRKFVSILADLTSSDAAVLDRMWKDWLVDEKKEFKQSATITYGPGVSGIDVHDEASVITLNRLGLIAPNYTRIGTYLPPGHDGDYKHFSAHEDEAIVVSDLTCVVFTKLGIDFCTAVITADM